jgi:integrase/recombinase XerD
VKRPTLTDLGRELVVFFDDFLSGQRGLSPHTIRSYRDTIVLWLQFTARETRRGVEQLTIRDLTEERVARFLRFLETERKNTIATRNARLGSIHVFARLLAGRHPRPAGNATASDRLALQKWGTRCADRVLGACRDGGTP